MTNFSQFLRLLHEATSDPIQALLDKPHTPISASDVKHNAFGVAATNNGYKLAQSFKVGNVQLHEFQNSSTKRNLHLVNHGSDFWTAHVDGKQFRLSPQGADEVQKFSEYLKHEKASPTQA